MQITFHSGTRTCTNCERTRPDGAFVLVFGGEVLALCDECLPVLARKAKSAAWKQTLQRQRDAKFGL